MFRGLCSPRRCCGVWVLLLCAAGLDFDDLEVQAQIVSPAEGAVVAAGLLEVQLNVWAPDPEAFGERYAQARVCLSLDARPYACWAVFGAAEFPLLANVPAGNHTLEAVLTDPRSTDETAVLRRSWSGTRRFTVAGAVAPVPAAAPEVPAAEAPAPDAENDEANRIGIPVVLLEQPREFAALPSHFEVTYTIETEDPAKFEQLFRRGFICFEVSTTLGRPGGVPCWALFGNTRRPLWTGLGDGFRSVRAWLLHPDSKTLIEETATLPRSLVNYFSVAPDGGPSPFLSLPQDGEKAETEWAEFYDAPSRRPFYQSANETTWDPPLGLVSPDHEAAVLTGYVDTVINGARRVLPVQAGTDVAAAAASFCRAHGVLNFDCAGAISRQIGDSLAAARANRPADPGTTPPPPPPPPPVPEAAPAAEDDPWELEPLEVAPPPSRLPRNAPPAQPAQAPITRLAALKKAFEADLITPEEYQAKRTELLALL
ncbi:hypothetical protein M885DRAFT_506062 [Pelagophyceae sp. CCMP2097]|nr:hypothetical protein M885DRAFT_506062 [Pelagophyceae sp. CCMP2097]